MNGDEEDRYSLILLVSLLFFLVLSAFLPDGWISDVVVVLSMYSILLIALLKIYEKSAMRWPALLLGFSSVVVTLVSVFYAIHTLRIANWVLLSIFFGYTSIALFSFLERGGAIIRAKLLAALGLYLILGMFYYAVFNLIEEIRPGSFLETGPTHAMVSRHSLIYFSMATLTTLGYGDMVPVTRPARMVAVAEAITGVFYVAITVARLVSAYQQQDRERG